MSQYSIITVSELSKTSTSSSTSSEYTTDGTDYFTYKGTTGQGLSPSSIEFLQTHPSFTPTRSYEAIASKDTLKKRVSTPKPASKKRTWPRLQELPLMRHAPTIYKQY